MKSNEYFLNLGGLLGKYSLVGIVTTSIYTILASTLILSEVFTPVLASSIAFFFTLPISYLGHGNFTFRVKKKNSKQLKRYLIYNIFGFVISNLIILLSDKSDFISPMIGVFIVALTLPVFNFFILKIFIFADEIYE